MFPSGFVFEFGEFFGCEGLLLNGEESVLEGGVLLVMCEINGVIEGVLDSLKPEAEVGGDMLVEEVGVEED